MDNRKIKTTQQYLRENIREWQDYSLKICDYRCEITGEPFEVIHHKYPFYKILEETFKELNIVFQEFIDYYSEDQLIMIKDKCLEIHFKYGAGACMTNKCHKELHSLFGNNITIEHYEQFIYSKKNNLSNISELNNIFNRKIKIKNDIDIEKQIKKEKLKVIKEKQKEIIKENLNYIKSEDFKNQCPITYNNIKRNIKYIEEFLLIALENIDNSCDLDKYNNIIFYTSNSYICKRFGLSENSSTEVSKKSALFTYHNLINKISEDDTPSRIIHASLRNNRHNYISCYSFFAYKDIFNEIEKQGEQWKENKYSMTGISREMFYRGEGLEVANWIYPQYTHIYDKKQKQSVDRTTTNKSNLRTDEIVKIIFDVLDNQQYITEKYIINELSSNGSIPTSKKEAEKQLKKSLQEILLSYGLERIRCNKNIKELYNVDTQGFPFIIVKTN